jgi:crotonobetainyl-CoA:carnitine CoA-transferase CaiB-like acyl-CoA transferase
MVLEMMQPRLGPLKVIGNPIKLDKTPASIRTPAPSLGEHTDEVLEKLGLDKSKILELKEAEVI